MEPQSTSLAYSIEDVPPWYLCLILGFQHYLTMFGATVSLPFVLRAPLCIAEFDIMALSALMSSIFVVSGIATFLQCTFGVRLPIIQGATFAYLTPALAILNLDKWKCEPIYERGSLNITEGAVEYSDEIWHSRMRELQGAIIVASITQVVVGATGLLGYMLRFIGPLTICPTISLVALVLFDTANDFCAKNWPLAVLTMVLVVVFSQFLNEVNCPVPTYSRSNGISTTPLKIFKLFPVIMAISISWCIAAICTFTGIFPDDPSLPSYQARTDTRTEVLWKSPWIRIPYPGQWGMPTVSLSAVLGMIAGVLASMLESIGDYYACARLSGAEPPATHAINRGAFVEGLCCIMAGAFGTGNGTTSYSENVGAIGITKVASRRVIQWGALLMIVFGCFAKFGAFFTTMPDPIVGGVFYCMFSMIFAVGMSNLQFVDLRSNRNLFVLGFTIFVGFSLPQYIKHNPEVIQTGWKDLDQICIVLLTTSMFVGGSLAMFLDNVIPGTLEERGFLSGFGHLANQKSSCLYELPYITPYLRQMRFMKYVPISPTYKLEPVDECDQPSGTPHNSRESEQELDVEHVP